MSEALNGDWEADYSTTDSDKRKWNPWFEYDSSLSAFRFFDSNFVVTIADGVTGAHLCLKSKELSDYMGKQFIDTFNKILIKNK